MSNVEEDEVQPNTQAVAAALARAGAAGQVQELEASTRTAAAAALGCPVGVIANSTVFPTTSYQELGLQPDRGPRPAELREGPPPAAVAGHRGRRAAQSNRSAGTASAPEWAGGGREGSAGEDRHAVTRGERAQICEETTAAAARATEQTQASASTDPHAVADAAWAASDFLSVAGRVVEGGQRRAADRRRGRVRPSRPGVVGPHPGAVERRLRAAHCGRAADRRPVRRPQRESAAARPTRPTGRPDRRGDPVAGEPEKGRAGRRRAPRRRAAALDRRRGAR